MLQFAHRCFASSMVAIKLFYCLGSMMRRLSNFWEQQLRFLRMMQPLRKLIHIKQHRAQHREETIHIGFRATLHHQA